MVQMELSTLNQHLLCIAEGTLRTGYVRYNTLELKIYKLMQARVDTTNGGLYIDSID
jgi:hypothetical protein